MITYLAVFSLAVLTSLLSTRCVMNWANRKGWVDQPDYSRKLHAGPMPRIGGTAIYLSLLLSLGSLYFFPTVVAASFRQQLFEAMKLLSLSGMMLLIGLWDDLKSLKPWTKFSAQIVVALTAWLLGFRILLSWSPTGEILQLGILSLPLTIVWIVGITNAFNLIDGMDGLAAGAALFAAASMLVPSLGEGQFLSPLMLLALAGSIIGFLKFNFNPASIFLGDSGSFLLGSMLSLLAVEYSYKSTTAFAIGVPIVALGLPVLDTITVVLRRFLNGKPMFLGDRRHIHHILIERGLKPRNAVILLYGVCGLFGLSSLLFPNPSGRITPIVLVLLGSCICFGIQQLHCAEFRELMGYVARGLRYQRRFLIGNVMTGRMIDGFRNARKLQDIMTSLSSFLDEMEFSRAEVRVPCLDEKSALLLKNWAVKDDGPYHCLYQWTPARKQGSIGNADNKAGIEASGRGLNTHFRLEFVFKITDYSARLTLPFEEVKDVDIGRLTFYHPTTARLPVSAVCLLSRQIWKEFEQAVNRIVDRSIERLSDQKADPNASASNSDHKTPVLASLPLEWAAPIMNRMTGTHSRH
jgi:UDP-GlcNAc:undecaprenyl-phosphate/decaprenyl-phosphate GlcNAc-1-phosphate transferase